MGRVRRSGYIVEWFIGDHEPGTYTFMIPTVDFWGGSNLQP
jgi:hypothetical protein